MAKKFTPSTSKKLFYPSNATLRLHARMQRRPNLHRLRQKCAKAFRCASTRKGRAIHQGVPSAKNPENFRTRNKARRTATRSANKAATESRQATVLRPPRRSSSDFFQNRRLDSNDDSETRRFPIIFKMFYKKAPNGFLENSPSRKLRLCGFRTK